MNTPYFHQQATLLNALLTQAKGTASLTPTDLSGFVQAATTLLQIGYDQVANAVSTVLSKTIISQRPYYQKFKILEVSEAGYGMHVRKLNYGDANFVDDPGYQWPVFFDSTHTANPSGDGESVDQFKIRKPIVQQTNFYGQSEYADFYSVEDKQFKGAFQSPESMGEFFRGYILNINNKYTQARETMGRSTLANFIGGILGAAAVQSAPAQDTERVIHLLTEYNAETGLSLTATTVMQPDNFPSFMRWVFARIKTICRLMEERSVIFQKTVSSVYIPRHTPMRDQRVFLLADLMDKVDANVLSVTFNPDKVNIPAFESVSYWQSIKSRDAINLTACAIGANGAQTTYTVNQSKIVGAIVDREALGYAVSDSTLEAARNSAGQYTTYWLHEVLRAWNDHTEKGVVLLLD